MSVNPTKKDNSQDPTESVTVSDLPTEGHLNIPDVNSQSTTPQPTMTLGDASSSSVSVTGIPSDTESAAKPVIALEGDQNLDAEVEPKNDKDALKSTLEGTPINNNKSEGGIKTPAGKPDKYESQLSQSDSMFGNVFAVITKSTLDRAINKKADQITGRNSVNEGGLNNSTNPNETWLDVAKGLAKATLEGGLPGLAQGMSERFFKPKPSPSSSGSSSDENKDAEQQSPQAPIQPASTGATGADPTSPAVALKQVGTNMDPRSETQQDPKNPQPAPITLSEDATSAVAGTSAKPLQQPTAGPDAATPISPSVPTADDSHKTNKAGH